MQGRIYRATSDDPWQNLAIEELLLDRLGDGEWALLLWSGRDSVVLGKHQNPWRECHLPRLAAEGVCLARRLSGGGTVYHDAGNLNVSFLLPREGYDREAIQRLVLRAMRGLGVPAELGERHILIAGGRKFSGNAFCFRRRAVLHHGTLLIRSDLARLQRYLVRTEPLVETRAIASVPSPVVNLTDFVPELSLDQVADAVRLEAEVHFGGARRVDPASLAGEPLTRLAARYASWEWCYGRTPPFDVTWRGQLGACRFVLTLAIKDACIDQARLEVEPAETAVAERLAVALVGCRFGHATVAERLRRDGSPLARELADWCAARGNARA